MAGGRPVGMELSCTPCNCVTREKICRQVHRDTPGGAPWVDLTEGVFFVACPENFREKVLCAYRRVWGREEPPAETSEDEFERLRGLGIEVRNKELRNMAPRDSGSGQSPTPR